MLKIVNTTFYKNLAERFPDLKVKLIQARIVDTPAEFIKKAVIISFMLSFGFCVLFLGGVLNEFGLTLYGILAFPFVFLGSFFFWMNIPNAKITALEKGINKEIVFAVRFLIIELQSGVPLYDCFVNMGRIYPNIGIYFRAIVDRVNMGTMMEDAITETVVIIPSHDLTKVFWQILNSIKTGADVTDALDSVVTQITKDQSIMVEEYGRKLNPLAMFYMLIAVIAPSLGITMLLIFASFMGFKLELPILLGLALFIGFIQFMFYGMIKSSRPAVEF